jgi:hypothetical protein
MREESISGARVPWVEAIEHIHFPRSVRLAFEEEVGRDVVGAE